MYDFCIINIEVIIMPNERKPEDMNKQCGVQYDSSSLLSKIHRSTSYVERDETSEKFVFLRIKV